MDYESEIKLSENIESQLISNIQDIVKDVDAVIISDYSLGTLTTEVISTTIKTCRSNQVPLIVDSRERPDLYCGATSVTPNISEVEKTIGKRLGTDEKPLDETCPGLREKWGVEALLVTRGKLGMSLFTGRETVHIPPFGMDDAVDVTGAGDTVASIYATALAAGLDFAESAQLANIAGGIVVTKKGTDTVSRDELKNALVELK
jgi:D-beta-D-heptose 7-phosphate kinase/D-beta-D-heptose 1-phosphate adenosyltransferase